MKVYDGSERRQYSRLDGNFVVSYRVKQLPDNYDLSQTKNVSQGGMLLTTNKKFDANLALTMKIRFPFVSERIEILGQVVDSKEVVKNLIYETRIRFLDLDQRFFKELGDFITTHMKKYKK